MVRFISLNAILSSFCCAAWWIDEKRERNLNSIAWCGDTKNERKWKVYEVSLWGWKNWKRLLWWRFEPDGCKARFCCECPKVDHLRNIHPRSVCRTQIHPRNIPSAANKDMINSRIRATLSPPLPEQHKTHETMCKHTLAAGACRSVSKTAFEQSHEHSHTTTESLFFGVFSLPLLSNCCCCYFFSAVDGLEGNKKETKETPSESESRKQKKKLLDVLCFFGSFFSVFKRTLIRRDRKWSRRATI